MEVKVPFNKIQVSLAKDRRVILFPYGDEWYEMEWDKVPGRFKELYVLKLKLSGVRIPEDLKEFEKDWIEVSEVEVKLDLSKARAINELNEPLE